jgi:hypothetical protein
MAHQCLMTSIYLQYLSKVLPCFTREVVCFSTYIRPLVYWHFNKECTLRWRMSSQIFLDIYSLFLLPLSGEDCRDMSRQKILDIYGLILLPLWGEDCRDLSIQKNLDIFGLLSLTLSGEDCQDMSRQ